MIASYVSASELFWLIADYRRFAQGWHKQDAEIAVGIKAEILAVTTGSLHHLIESGQYRAAHRLAEDLAKKEKNSC